MAGVAESAYTGNMHRTKAVAVFALASFMLTGGFGMLHAGTDMRMGSDGGAHNCPFMGMTALCHMTPPEHIEAWQGMFASLPRSLGAALAFALLAFICLATLGRVAIRVARTAYRALRRPQRQAYAPPSNPLQELFSSGILNPKYF